MATVTGLTSARMTTMENATIIDGNIVGNDLVLVTKGGTNINAGNVRGPIGPSGAAFIICTSTTRPTLSAGEEGKTIYETDTNLIYVWHGTSWFPLYSGPPPGSMFPWLGATAPLNHVLMYGQVIANAQTSYPVLWANLDATFKSGSSLLVPDLRGRIPVGQDNMGGSAASRITSAVAGFSGLVLGAAGGNQSMQTHNHTSPAHDHEPNAIASFLIHGPGSLIDLQTGSGYTPGVANSTSATAVAINNNGAGSSQNVQPSIIVNWILKLL